MKELIGRYALPTAVWGIVLSYIVSSAVLSCRHRAEQVVAGVEIEVSDSTAQGHLVTSRQVREWILRSGINTIGVPVGSVDLAGIEAVVSGNGFVDRVDTYISYTGVLHIDVRQLRPMMRLMVDDYNAYVTESGFVFRSPAASALYVPVVTGTYAPPFPPTYEGSVRDCVDARKAEVDERIRKIERDKIPVYEREDSVSRLIRDERRRRVKKDWFESKTAYRKRVDEFVAEKTRNLKRLRGELRYWNGREDALAERQNAQYRIQKKLDKRYEDFRKLINFVGWLENDDFWRSEIVQIVAGTVPSGALELELIPRSGSYVIVFGQIENVEAKFDKLMRFYRDGLRNIGWDEYSSINIAYDGQVVCHK